MTPALPDILMGQFVALSTPLPPEAGGDYAAGRTGMLAMLAILGAQEAERGIAVRLWENAAIRDLFAGVAADCDDALGGRLAAAAVDTDTRYEWAALDAANAELRRLLIDLHEAVEARGDAPRDRAILGLYADMARERRLVLPTG
ncbi:MAG: hypothetical protein ABI376_09460 [Caulobacteraceae bacterium]